MIFRNVGNLLAQGHGVTSEKTRNLNDITATCQENNSTAESLFKPLAYKKKTLQCRPIFHLDFIFKHCFTFIKKEGPGGYHPGLKVSD